MTYLNMTLLALFSIRRVLTAIRGLCAFYVRWAYTFAYFFLSFLVVLNMCCLRFYTETF